MMTAAGRVGTVARMRSAHGKRWRSSEIEDLCLVAALLVAAELEIVFDGLGADCAALAALATLPLAFRRRWPVASFGCVSVLVPTLDRALGSPWGSNANALVIVVLAAAYSLGAHAPLRRSLPALLGAAAWLATLEAVWGDGEDYAFLVLLLGVPWLSGRGVRGYRRQAERLRAVTSRLERERAVSERVAIARERQRMAHETHDAIAHAVGEMVLQASGAEEVLERDPERARAALATVQDTGREAVDELRAILGSCVRMMSRRRRWDATRESSAGSGRRASGPGQRSLTPASRSCCWRWVPDTRSTPRRSPGSMRPPC
jgi:signal transduction histidine kinase